MRSVLRKSLAALVASLLAFTLNTGVARGDGIDPGLRQDVALMLRILAYDRNLDSRVKDGVVVVTIYDEENESSAEEARAIAETLRAFQETTQIAGHALTSRSIPFHSGALEADYLESLGATAIYLCGGLEGAFEELSELSRESDALSFTTREDAVRAGVAVGIVPKGESRGILVNLPSSRLEGANLDAALLRHAEVIQ